MSEDFGWESPTHSLTETPDNDPVSLSAHIDVGVSRHAIGLPHRVKDTTGQ